MSSSHSLVFLALAPFALGCGMHSAERGVTTTTSMEVTSRAPMKTEVVPMQEYADADPAALDDFRADLDPYGRWVIDRDWGTVWVPSRRAAGENFRPYVTNGHWAWDKDYVWMSDSSWGAITFHYGRWALINGLGWSWIPGRRYAGAWVVWSVNDGGYIGWAPAPPRWRWNGREAIEVARAPEPFAYVAKNRMFDHHLGSYVLVEPRALRVAQGSEQWSPPPVQMEPERKFEDLRVGPRPEEYGADARALPRPPPNDRYLERARSLAHPPSHYVPPSD